MSKFNGRTLISATMHENIFVKGAGDVKKELSSVDVNGAHGIKMTLDEPFVVLEVPERNAGGGYSGRVITVPVPITNFKSLVLGKDAQDSKA